MSIRLSDALHALAAGVGTLSRQANSLTALDEIKDHIRETGGYPFPASRDGETRSGAFLGMNRDTGQPLYGDAHIWQSIGDILSVPTGSRFQRRGYGLPIELMDMPITPQTMIEIVAALAAAFRAWEPRLKLRRVQISEAGADGIAELVLITQTIASPAPGLDPEPSILRIPLRPPSECRT